MKDEDWILLLTAGLVIYLIAEKEKDAQDIANLRTQNMKLSKINTIKDQHIKKINQELVETIDKKDSLPTEVKESLKKLIEDYEFLDENIRDELKQISNLISIDEKPKAIFSLSKIIENLLKLILESNKSFHVLIEMAKNENVFSKEEYHFANGIRELRNKEGHELNVQIDNYLSVTSLMFGFGLVSKLQIHLRTPIDNMGLTEKLS